MHTRPLSKPAQEGQQASLAADVSLAQFSHATRCLLWHGRNAYRRSARLTHFVVHRGLIISIMQAVFSFLFFFAAISLFVRLLSLCHFLCVA